MNGPAKTAGPPLTPRPPPLLVSLDFADAFIDILSLEGPPLSQRNMGHQRKTLGILANYIDR